MDLLICQIESIMWDKESTSEQKRKMLRHAIEFYTKNQKMMDNI